MINHQTQGKEEDEGGKSVSQPEGGGFGKGEGVLIDDGAVGKIDEQTSHQQGEGAGQSCQTGCKNSGFFAKMKDETGTEEDSGGEH